jgi:superfamily I DNA/RNA helicase
MVRAGAGTGKTTVLVERFVRAGGPQWAIAKFA